MLNAPPLPDWLAKTLNEDQEKIEEDIRLFKLWLKQQPYMRTKECYMDHLLITFLRGSKYSLEQAKQNLIKVGLARIDLPEFFTNRSPLDERMHYLLRCGFFVPIVDTDKENDPITFICRACHFNPEEFDPKEILKACNILADIIVYRYSKLPITGYRVLIDSKGVKLSYMSLYDSNLMRRLLNYYQNCQVIPFKGCHIINVQPSFKPAFLFFKDKVDKWLHSMVNIHFTLNDLHHFIPQKLLPAEYGGTNSTCGEIIEHWIGIMKESEEMISDLDSCGIDEKQAKLMQKCSEETFDTGGTFRKLCID